jgi:hypothetical protein
MVSIGTAGNVRSPTFYAILDKGYHLTELEVIDENGKEYLRYQAEKDGVQFVSDDWLGLKLLGLITLWETLGETMADRLTESQNCVRTLPIQRSYYDDDAEINYRDGESDFYFVKDD